MRGAVERLPVGGALEPEVGAHVDDEHIVAELLGDGGGLPVREGEKDDVVPGEHFGGGRFEHPVGERQQMPLQATELLARVGVAGEGADLGPGVGQEQSKQFPARVSARSCDCCSYCHRTLHQ